MSDLTAEEQKNVRAALRFLHARCGGWKPVAKVLRVGLSTVRVAAARNGTPTPTLAFRVARFVGVSIDDLLAGKYPPPGTCPYCGHRTESDNV